jgi:hypothetical protein
MAWPDIFFKAKKRTEPVPTPDFAPAPVAPKSNDPQPPIIQPVPPEAMASGSTSPAPIKSEPIRFEPPKIEPPNVEPLKPEPIRAETSTKTLPAMHGVVLRPPARLSQPAIPTPPLKNLEQLRAEADPARALANNGGLRMLKPGEIDPAKGPAPIPAATPAPVGYVQPPVGSPAPVTPPMASPVAAPVASAPPPFPSFAPAPRPVVAPDARKIEPPLIPAKPAMQGDSPFILKPTSGNDASPKVTLPAGPGPLLPFGSIAPRKAKMADVARIVLPPKRDETDAAPSPSQPLPMVVPPAFPVAAMTVRVKVPTEKPLIPRIVLSSPTSIAPFQSATPVAKAPASGPIVSPLASATSDLAPNKDMTSHQLAPATPNILPPVVPEAPKSPVGDTSFSQLIPTMPFTSGMDAPAAPLIEVPKVDPEAHKPEPTAELLPKIDPEAHKPEPPVNLAPKVEPAPVVETFPRIEPEPFTPLPPIEVIPKVDPEAHKPGPTTEVLPKIDPEAHKPQPPAAPLPRAEPEAPKPESSPAPFTLEKANAPSAGPEKREFHLANGEKVGGVVLSETPEAIYIQHGTLGVITIPRNQIAKRLVEIILMNGDRIVGDIMAETADTLYVRHSSLGMLTVPRAQRSTRVVEAILKDGDRVLGEVLTETETFTVIRSATLGTVTVPHEKIAMLNRKIEQIEMKSLPPAFPELKDTPSS